MKVHSGVGPLVGPISGRHRPRGMGRPAPARSPQGAAPRHGEGGQRRCMTAAPATRPAAGRARGPPPPQPAPQTQPHTTRPPDNNNRMEEGRMSCRQQPAPPHSNAAKMSPHITIDPQSVLADHAPSPCCDGCFKKNRIGTQPLSDGV